MVRKGDTIVLSLLLILVLAAGCTSTSSTLMTTSQSTSAKVTTSAGATTAKTAETTTKPVVLKCYWDSPELYNGWKWGNDPVTKYITEQTGITLDIRYAASSNHEELYAMIAAGANFTDLLRSQYVPALYDEKYVLSLNKLADKYDPKFYDVLPYQYQEVWALSDGDIYFLTYGYGDAKKLAEIPGGKKSVSTFCGNTEKETALGSPPLDTLDNVYKAAKMAKDAGAKYPIFLSSYGPTADLDYLQIVNISYGGQQYIFKQNSGTVTFNIKTDAYKNAAKWLNSCYRGGLIQADNLTFKGSNDETVRKLAQSGDPLIVIGHEWQLRQYRLGMENESLYLPIEPPLGKGVSASSIVMNDYNASNIGGNDHTYIMASTKNPDRCLQFLTFMLRPETQLLCEWGFEGKDYNLDKSVDKDGRYRPTQELIADQKNLKNPEYMNKWGGLNMFLLLANSRWCDCYFNRPYNAAFPKDYSNYSSMQISLGKKYAKPFKTLALTTNFTNADDINLYKNVIDAWKAGEAVIIVANDDAAFEKAFAQTIADMETAGLSKLEKKLTERYDLWSSKLKE